MEIFDGGIIHRHGGVKVGDFLVAANGLKLSGHSFNDAQLKLEKAMEDDSVRYKNSLSIPFQIVFKFASVKSDTIFTYITKSISNITGVKL